MLSDNEIEKYQRHFLIDNFTVEHQEKLKNAKVLVIGAGGLGSPLLMYLTAAGVGNIGIVEKDSVALVNLQRQILYSNNEIGQSKAVLSARKLRALNPDCQISVFKDWWTDELGFIIGGNYDMIVDCSDNFESRYTSDEISRHFGIPFVYGAIFQMEGQMSVFNYKGGKSYKEVFPDHKNKANKTVIGVLGPVPGIIGSLQASETIKIITGIGEVMTGKLFVMSLLNNSFQVINL